MVGRSQCLLLHLLPLLQPLIFPIIVSAKFYIGHYKTLPMSAEVAHNPGHARSMPYIVLPGEMGSSSVLGTMRLNRYQRVPAHHQYSDNLIKHPLYIADPTMFSSHPNNYGNDKHNVYTHVQKNNVKYVVPPFTPGGKVRVEFQFWIPITVSGFFINGRDLEAAMKSPNPTAYITALFFKHLATNSSISDILSNLESPVKIGVQNFLDRALPYLSHITSRDSVGAFTFKDEENVGNSRHKRSPEDADGWVTIGGEQSEAVTPRAPLLNHIPSSLAPAGQGPNNRVLWNGGDHHLSHNDISNSADKVRPSLDFEDPIDYHYLRPFSSSFPSSRPFPSYRPSPSVHPSHNNRPAGNPSYSPSSDLSPSNSPSLSDFRPPFHLTSFDDIPSSVAVGERGLDVSTRLSRLDYFFTNLHLDHEECRRRVLCEVSRDPDTFAPLSDMINGETRLPGNLHELSRTLLNTAEGARLLSYVEAVKTGEDRTQECDVYRYRCRMQAREVINTDILPIWREVVRWLTVKVLAQDTSLA